MSNEAVLVKASAFTLEANGASAANNTIAAADDSTYDITVSGSSYPDGRFVLAATFSVAPTEGTTIALYARPIDIDGTNDAEVPETTRPTQYIGSFVVNNVTTTQYMELYAQNLPWKADYYIHNNGTGQTISAGWTLKVTPYTLKPAV